MGNHKARSRALVTLKLEVHLTDVWGPDCPLSQVYEQGVRAAQGLLERIINEHRAIRLIGEPKVTAVIQDSEQMERENG